MKQFESPQSRLTALPPIMKILSIFFLVLAWIGFCVGFYMGVEKAGLSPSDWANYYRGSEADMRFPKTTIELLETAHFHLMSMPLLFLVVSHLMIMSAVSNKVKGWLIGVGSISLVFHIVSPFLIRFVSAQFSYVKWLATIGLGASLLLMTLIEIYELSQKRRTKHAT